MLPVKVIKFPDSHKEQLLQYIATCKTHFKVAPAYVLYLCALHRSTKPKSKLIQFLNNAAMMIHNKIENLKDNIEEVFWLANASELLHFFKYDVSLSKYSEPAQSILIITIQNVFHNLLTYFMKCINSATSDCNYLEKTMDAINRTTAAFQYFGVNVAFINQLLSFLLQWMCDRLISSIQDPPSYREYFKEIKCVAKLMDDERLLSKVMEFARLIDNTSQNIQDTNLVNYFKLKWEPANFLETDQEGIYTTLIEKTAKLMAQINGGKTRPNNDVTKLHLAIPYDGYSCHNFRGIPRWLSTFLKLIHDGGLCTFKKELNSSGYWDFRLKGQKVERYCLTNIQFNIQSGYKCFKSGAHVTGFSPAVSSLTVGDIILSVNGSTLTDLIQGKAEDVIRRCPSVVQLKVIKIETYELCLETSSTSNSHQPPGIAHSDEIVVHNETVKFNLLENNLNSKEDLSESIPAKQEDFFTNIKKEVEELDSMLKNFCGNSENDRSYEYMKEVMMRNIIKLDNMDTGNNQEVRKRRRNTIYMIQEKIEQLNAKLTSNQEKAKAIVKDDPDVHLGRKVLNDQNSAGAKQINTSLPTKESKNCASPSVKTTEDILENRQMQRRHQLIFETKYCLNELATKFVSTGISPSGEHNIPAVQFSIGENHIVLGMEDWHALLGFEEMLREHFRNENKQQKEEVFASYRLYFVTSSQTKFVGIRDQNCSIFLDQENVDNLLQLSHLISNRMHLIKSICFDTKWFEPIITSAATSPDDPLVTVQKLLESQANNIDPLIPYLIMEYINFYPDVIKKRVEMKRRCHYTEP